jgi:concanavalin A-like lectin/glucanase superfamily protein
MSYGYVTPTGGFVIELWFKRDALGATVQTLVNQRTQASVAWTIGGINGYGRQFLLEMTAAGALSFQIINETTTAGTTLVSWTDPSPTGYASDNQWHHLAFVLQHNPGFSVLYHWYIYLDGLTDTNDPYAQGALSAGQSINWNPGVLTFGAQYAPHMGDWGSFIWNKWLAYFAVYDKFLTPTQILSHYTAGSGGTVYYDDDEVTRLNRISDWAELPDQSREFESPLVRLQGIQVAGTNALTAMQDTASAASGLLFADGQSRMVYHSRRHRYNRWTVATLAESSDSAPEIGLTFSIDDTNIFNDVRGDRPFGSTIRLVDNVSKAAYGRKVYSFSIPVITADELQNAVSWIASQYREAVVRVSEVSLRAESSDIIEWLGTGGITIGDHIVFDELPPEDAPEVTMDFVVEKIGLNVDIKNRVWVVNLQLSPYELTQVFQVGVSNLGDQWKIAY